MTVIQIFKNEQFGEVRSYYEGDMLWMCLPDVCKAVGIENSRNTVSRLNQKGVHSVDTLTNGGKYERDTSF